MRTESDLADSSISWLYVASWWLYRQYLGNTRNMLYSGIHVLRLGGGGGRERVTATTCSTHKMLYHTKVCRIIIELYSELGTNECMLAYKTLLSRNTAFIPFCTLSYGLLYYTEHTVHLHLF